MADGSLDAYLLVALGSALGGMARFALSGLIARRFSDAFPWGTLVVNISGCMLIGLLEALTTPGGPVLAVTGVRDFFMVGICGGYTTFSSFSLQTLALVQAGKGFGATANIVLSVALCLLGVWLGYVAGMRLI